MDRYRKYKQEQRKNNAIVRQFREIVRKTNPE